jgi:hypothetical protein
MIGGNKTKCGGCLNAIWLEKSLIWHNLYSKYIIFITVLRSYIFLLIAVLSYSSRWYLVWRCWYKLEFKKISVGLCSTSIFKDTTVVKHLSLLHDKYIIVSADKAPSVIVFVCKSHYVDCLIKELGIDNSLDNPTYTPKTMRKRKSWTIISLFYGPFQFQPKIKNWIYQHCTGFLYYTSVLSNQWSKLWLGLP